jgi:hypothetical protein
MWPVSDTMASATSAHPPWRCCCGPLRLRSPGESSRLTRHATLKPWSLCRWSARPDCDYRRRGGQEAQKEAQEAETEANAEWRADWWAAQRPGTHPRTVSSGGCNLCSRPIPELLRWSAMRSNGHQRHCRDVLLRTGGDFLHHRGFLLLGHLRLSRRRGYLRSLPGPFLQRHTAVLRRSDLQQRLLRWLPRPRDFLYRRFTMLLQQLHRWRLSVGAGRTVRTRCRLPLLLPRPQLQRRLREWQLRDLNPAPRLCSHGPAAFAEWERRGP